MTADRSHQIVYLTLIAGRKLKNDLLSELSGCGAQLITTIYGKGTVKASYLKNLLGLIPEENKAVITCILPGDKADAIMRLLIDKYAFHQPNTGIAFTTSLDKLSF